MSSVTPKTEQVVPETPAKPRLFLRSASFQKVVHVCSQNYVLLLAIGYWLKTWQTTVYSTIALARLTILTAWRAEWTFQKAVAYLNIFAIYCQLLACLYFLTGVFLPLGLIFLIASLHFIGVVYSCVTVAYVKREEKKLNKYILDRKKQ